MVLVGTHVAFFLTHVLLTPEFSNFQKQTELITPGWCIVGRHQCLSPASRRRVDELARHWTAYGPAPITLAAKLTNTQGNYVRFCSKLRESLVENFGLDLEAYSIQWLWQQVGIVWLMA